MLETRAANDMCRAVFAAEIMTEEVRSHLENLLVQQKYGEALSLLDDLMETDPSDREIRMHHLLVVRILVLHWNLSRAAPEQTSIASNEIVPSDGEMYQGKIARLSPGMKRFIGAGAALCLIALLAFSISERSNPALQLPQRTITSVDELDAANTPVITVADKAGVNTDELQEAGTVGELHRLAGSATGEGKGLFGRSVETGESFPVEYSNHAEEKKAAPSGAEHSSIPPQRSETKTSAERSPISTTLNTASSKNAPVTVVTSRKPPRKILGQFQSRKPIPIRKEPRFAASTVQDIEGGTSLSVLEFAGSWAKVELEPGGLTGFVRREYLIQIDDTGSNMAQLRFR